MCSEATPGLRRAFRHESSSEKNVGLLPVVLPLRPRYAGCAWRVCPERARNKVDARIEEGEGRERESPSALRRPRTNAAMDTCNVVRRDGKAHAQTTVTRGR